MNGELYGRDLTDDEMRVEEAWSTASALGEAVWVRMCAAAGKDPKDLATSAMHDRIVGFVRDAAFVLERDGFEGVATWLETEKIEGAKQ